MKKWQPDSWQQFPISQNVTYPSTAEVELILRELRNLPALVTPFEIQSLQQQLGEAALGKRFLLQGGDCAESFSDCNEKVITNKIRILLQMSLVLLHGLQQPIVRVGRMAGQYAKPRSSNTETQNDMTLPSYRGDLINDVAFSELARTADPWRMLQGYQYAALTLNYIRALVGGGFADLYHTENWDLEFAKQAQYADEYHKIVRSLQDALQIIKTLNVVPEALRQVDFFVSHEALHLPYEEAQTKLVNNHWYNLSTHFPWLGMRTATLEGAHLEYLRGIANPIAIKIGPAMTAEWLQELITILNPNNIPGRLTFITRFGAKQIKEKLPALIAAAQKTKKIILWSCDPMHGNTMNAGEYKTRQFDDILAELKQAFIIHRECGSHLGGVHFELTGENVTECVGGASGITAADLKHAYQSLVDPRLNYQQALEMAMLIAHDAKA